MADDTENQAEVKIEEPALVAPSVELPLEEKADNIDVKPETKEESELKPAVELPDAESKPAVDADEKQADVADAQSNAQPTDKEIIAKLQELLQTADLNVETGRTLRTKLEAHFHVDLKDKKQLIKQEVEDWLAKQEAEEEGGGEADEPADADDEEPVKRKRKGGGGFSKTLCYLSKEMSEFLGTETMPRPQIVKQIWAYIKEHSLQDPSDKRKIMLDDKLATLFKTPLTMFSMNKQLSRHIKSADQVGTPAAAAQDDDDDDAPKSAKRKTPAKRTPAAKRQRSAAKQKKRRDDDDEDDEVSSEEEDDDNDEDYTGKSKGKASGFSKPNRLSEQLAAFVKQDEMSRGDLTKFFWAYFKENNLLAGREVQCDDALKQLFNVDSFQAFGVQKHLKPHILKD